MHPATIAGIPGASEVRSRRRSEATREYRGVFAFRSQQEPMIVKLLASRDEVEYEGVIDGAVRRMRVRITDVSLERGMAYFQGIGDPYDASGRTGAGAG